MKLLLLIAFVAAASAAQIKVQSLVLPEAPKPEVYEAPETQNEEDYNADYEKAPVYVQMIDISPMIVPDEVIKQLLENQGFPAETVNVVDSPFDGPVEAVRVVDTPFEVPVEAVRVIDAPFEVPVEAVRVVDGPFDAPVEPVQVVDAPFDAPVEAIRVNDGAFDAPVEPVHVVDAHFDAPVEAVRVVDGPIKQNWDNLKFLYVPDIGSEVNVDPVQVVDGPVDADSAIAPDAQVDPVIVIDNVLYDLPLEYRRDLPVYNDPMLR